MSDITNQLLSLAGAESWYTIHCYTCNDTIASSYRFDLQYPWALKLHCDKCNQSWWICKEHHHRKHFKTSNHTTRHHREYHSNDDPMLESPELPEIPMPLGQTMAVEHIHRAATIQFFKTCQYGVGIETLVARAYFKNESITGNLDPDDIRTFMTTAHFISTISRSQREDLALVLEHVSETAKYQSRTSKLPPSKKSRPSKKIIQIPPLTNKQIIRSTIIEGKYSLYENLPHPLVRTLANDAYILPSEVLADFIGHGLLHYQTKHVAGNHPVESLAQSYIAKHFIRENLENDEKCETLFASIWSDGFDPNYTMKNRGSAWIMTLCIQPAHIDHVDLHHIYPIAIGSEKDNHDAVMRIIFDDIMSLKRRPGESAHVEMYDGKDKTNKKVSIHLLAVTQDQPERRSFHSLLGGNSLLHSRFGWIADYSQIKDKMRSCGTCQEQLEQAEVDEYIARECNDCYNWCAHPSKVLFRPPGDLPADFRGNPLIQMTDLDYDTLNKAVDRLYDEIQSGTWTKSVGRAYLHLYGIHDKAKDAIIECAMNCRTYAHAVEEENIDMIHTIEAERQRDPSKYSKWVPPAIWGSELAIGQSHEAGMHLLFLGVVKTIIFAIQDWSSLRKKETSLRKELGKLTKHIEKKHLSWCKVLSFGLGKKLGSWFSDNFMGFCRVLPWMYACLPTLAEDPEYTPPDKPMDKWTKVENVAFLASRGISTVGNAATLRGRVAEHVELGTPVVQPSGGPLQEVRELILSMWVMVSHLMGMTSVTPHTTRTSNQLIRVFLDRVYDFDVSSRADKKNPMWLSSYNFLGLLNLPAQIKNLGPIRNRWEGGVRGEKFLRQVKPVVGSTRRVNWQKNLMTNLLRQRELLILKEYQAMNEINEERPEEDPDTDATTIYHSIAEINRDFTDHRTISCVVHDETKLYICFRTDGEIWALPVDDAGGSKFFWGLCYRKYTIISSIENADVEENPSIILLTNLDVTSYGLMLPLLNSGTEDYYAIVDSRWQSMDADGSFRAPCVTNILSEDE